MSSAREIVYSVRTILKEHSDDSKLSDPLLLYLFNRGRSVILRRDFENGHTVNAQIEQDLGLLELELVDKSECPDIETDCHILRTIVDIPKFVETYQKNLVTYVGTVEKDINFQEISVPRIRWTKYGKYTKNQRFFTLRGNKLYIINDKILTHINVRGILDDPTDGARFKTCKGAACFSYDQEYPSLNWLESAVFDLLRKGELDVYFNSMQDKNNDSNDLKEPNVKAG